MHLTFISKPDFRRATMSLVTCFLIAGCVPGNEPKESANNISAPRMTMDLPVSLSGIVSTSSTKATSEINNRFQAAEAVTDPSQCEQYFDPNANFMENGYSMTRFLVGLSQQQSCFADFIMGTVVTMGADWINKGLISLPIDENDPEAPSHAQIEQSGDTVKVWLYFGTPGSDLPADRSNTQTLYLTWTGAGENIQGQFFMVNMPQDSNDPDAPEGARVDFTRTASTAENIIFLKMRTGHSGGLGGFRVNVNQTGIDAAAVYTAKGLITFLGQPFPNLPAGLSLPEFATSAVVDANGLGASTANFNNFAVSLAFDTNQNGEIEPANNEFDLGSYQFTISDKTYFDPALNIPSVNTPYLEQVIEWRDKSILNAIYVADHPRVQADVPAQLANYTMFKCLESELICDYNGNGSLDSDIGEWQGWGLGDGYLTNTCIDDATTVNNNCNAFIDNFFSQNMFGFTSTNSTDPEPTEDWRNTALGSLTQLTSIHPDEDSTGETTFNIPDAPER